MLALPRGYTGAKRVPLVFDFHGFVGNKEQQEANTGLAREGSARGFVVVTPDSLGNPMQWNEFAAPTDADDFGFVGALLTDLEHRLCIDATRVFAAGHSNGAAFSGFLVCKPPYRFAAVAMVSATTPTSCPEGVSPSALAIAGTADPQVPYAGGQVGDSPVHIPAATTTITAYATQYGCRQPGEQGTVAPGVTSLSFRGCQDGDARHPRHRRRWDPRLARRRRGRRGPGTRPRARVSRRPRRSCASSAPLHRVVAAPAERTGADQTSVAPITCSRLRWKLMTRHSSAESVRWVSPG